KADDVVLGVKSRSGNVAQPPESIISSLVTEKCVHRKSNSGKATTDEKATRRQHLLDGVGRIERVVRVTVSFPRQYHAPGVFAVVIVVCILVSADTSIKVR
ncbi:unnamed protein product, partial [Ectocarpus sp. 12 AP-2014]